MENKEEALDVPVDIVASQAGMVQKILPLQGNAKVQKGDYVNKGDLLISGRYKYHSTDYSRGDKEFTQYQHAHGKVMAKVPCHLEYYFEKTRRQRIETGSYFTGIAVHLLEILILIPLRDGADMRLQVRTEHEFVRYFVHLLPFSAPSWSR